MSQMMMVPSDQSMSHHLQITPPTTCPLLPIHPPHLSPLLQTALHVPDMPPPNTTLTILEHMVIARRRLRMHMRTLSMAPFSRMLYHLPLLVSYSMMPTLPVMGCSMGRPGT